MPAPSSPMGQRMSGGFLNRVHAELRDFEIPWSLVGHGSLARTPSPRPLSVAYRGLSRWATGISWPGRSARGRSGCRTCRSRSVTSGRPATSGAAHRSAAARTAGRGSAAARPGGVRSEAVMPKQSAARPPWIELIDRGDVGGLRRWLERGGDVEDEDPKTRNTPLVYAACCGPIEIVHLLLAYG